MTCATLVMIVGPPGVPTTISRLPALSSTIDGVMADSIRLLPATAFASPCTSPNMYGLVQGEANAVAGNKRMLSAMTPSIVLDSAGNLEMVVGTPGGPTIITSVAQVILNVLDQKMSLADAVAAPRIHHQALPDQTYYEHGGLSDATVRALEAMGHKMEERRGHSGFVAGIQKTAGGWIGVADPRIAGGAIGY